MYVLNINFNAKDIFKTFYKILLNSLRHFSSIWLLLHLLGNPSSNLAETS